MKPALGLVELNSIALGMLACDAMAKKAEVQIITAKSICPGKFTVIIGGMEAEVEESLKAGLEAGADTVIDHLFIPNIHEEVFPAIAGTTGIKQLESLGIIETFSIASCIIAADTGVKAANVKLLEIRLAMGLGGKAYVTMIGDVHDVESAVDAGTNAIIKDGWLVRKVVIPRPHEDLNNHLL